MLKRLDTWKEEVGATLYGRESGQALYLSSDGTLRNRKVKRAILGTDHRITHRDLDNPWAVISALFAGMFDEHTIEWLNKRGYLRWDQRGQGEAIIAAVNAVIGRQR